VTAAATSRGSTGDRYEADANEAKRAADVMRELLVPA
jgi:hypothetical protein